MPFYLASSSQIRMRQLMSWAELGHPRRGPRVQLEANQLPEKILKPNLLMSVQRAHGPRHTCVRCSSGPPPDSATSLWVRQLPPTSPESVCPRTKPYPLRLRVPHQRHLPETRSQLRGVLGPHPSRTPRGGRSGYLPNSPDKGSLGCRWEKGEIPPVSGSLPVPETAPEFKVQDWNHWGLPAWGEAGWCCWGQRSPPPGKPLRLCASWD